MRWPTARTRRPPESDIPPRASVPGRRRLVIAAAGLAGVLVVALISAAFAGVFSGTLRAAAASQPAGQLVRPARTAPATPARAGGPAPVARTSCASVAHIGDSTSVGMASAQWLPDAAQRLGAQYRDAGVRHVLISASGGRSIAEELPGQVNGYRVASAWYRQGYRGCWVFALGTNDAANVAAGSAVGLTARIEEMMSAAHGEPVLWVNTQTELSSGPWSEASMRQWNSALTAACPAYQNLRIFNWAAMVKPAWHLADGIHYTSAGYAIRAHAIARALATAFPAGGHSSGCVVG